jgi:uncharacterized protein YbjT (DUF2867 family)
MKLILLGATGMVGSGTLREALGDSEIESVLSVARRSCGVQHPKLQELILPDLFEIGSAERQLTGWDACVWALGISSVGLNEAAYARITEDLTLLWARTLLRVNPDFSFCYCSGGGADGRAMWARVRQRVEKSLKALPFRYAGCVRPMLIQPGPGIGSRVAFYQTILALSRPFFPLIVKLFPRLSTTSERLGRAMLQVVKGRADKYILESIDINHVGC